MSNLCRASGKSYDIWPAHWEFTKRSHRFLTVFFLAMLRKNKYTRVTLSVSWFLRYEDCIDWLLKFKEQYFTNVYYSKEKHYFWCRNQIIENGANGGFTFEFSKCFGLNVLTFLVEFWVYSISNSKKKKIKFMEKIFIKKVQFQSTWIYFNGLTSQSG